MYADEMTRVPVFPTAEETMRHPSYSSTIWNLEPDRKGKCPVAKDRGGPFNIAWEIHGHGPSKIIFIMGLAGLKTSWQRQTKYFGHDNASKYSVLILDNRGMGESDVPYIRYSTSEMAHDALEVLTHVGWTASRSVHLFGISMGGMISQELAFAAPNLFASVTLLCTAPWIENTKSLLENMRDRAAMLVPKSADRSIADTSLKLFPADWLVMPDEAAELPNDATYKCGPADGGQGYGRFESNFQRFQAQELIKRNTPGLFSIRGFLQQLVAAGWHHKSPAQLKQLADQVGRERIAVIHGLGDVMIDSHHGRLLAEHLQPGVVEFVEGMGHAPIMDRVPWMNKWLEERIATVEKMSA
ncbi:glycylpeptide N-tetradecanoyltransferase [Colletotrichum melonis]|uniref:Glycylpeptide N-tetradecanoyltransferase n=2 Tax=Colletotrichum acutatum species complex TaxID=2707335 RepID=A0AAI9UC45_9PEZI|nr:glycylpeptide N-tetradecanoyltransferase [Colletotrichum limetticola]KAK1455637.1 glycylpeptide N-tetradecanoyltransferase [Colletotrichum melonis]